MVERAVPTLLTLGLPKLHGAQLRRWHRAQRMTIWQLKLQSGQPSMLPELHVEL